MANLPAVQAPTRDLLPVAQDWGIMLQMSEALFKSGLLPAHIKNTQSALAIIQKGIELGIPPMYALSNIVVVQGRPTANAELMLALIYRDHGDDAVVFTESTPTRCTISYKRRGWATRQAHSFTIEEARAANLVKAGPWTQYPAAMLRARCISATARMAFPDSIGGMYSADELGATVEVIDGQVQITALPESPPEPLPIGGEMANTGRQYQTHTILAELTIMQSVWRELTGEIVTIPEGKNLETLQRFRDRWQEKITAAKQEQAADPFPELSNPTASIRQPVAAGVADADESPFSD